MKFKEENRVQIQREILSFLTQEELRQAAIEYKRQQEMADLLSVAESEGIEIPSEQIDDVLAEAKHLRDKNEDYMNAYWASLKDALIENSHNQIELGDVEEHTIIAVEEENGRKYVHFFGYGYYADDGTDTPYRFLEYTFLIAPLEDVLKEGVADYESNHQDSCKQYITDCNEEKCLDIYRHYDNGKQPKLLSELTLDTPVGTYII